MTIVTIESVDSRFQTTEKYTVLSKLQYNVRGKLHHKIQSQKNHTKLPHNQRKTECSKTPEHRRILYPSDISHTETIRAFNPITLQANGDH